ncbi:MULTISPECIES: DUF4391 domain-containing protein [unclassified Curtobacterium]|uniref:DUF4391 domain-containing protein n=1 Tax=unclassified Curtobacterium TaxID=257496 RepID=UPI000F4651DF|nr:MULTISPECIES: DUF4391 domain-containing protein [unclassified Curtobacterium]ROQ05755.1 uncharacterized protein DUF4391 [Curtobacterium sp. PhB171]ROQ23098.1 uncharacterized protein DUF4391 [Curtobacterium sp. PhB170]ROS33949.1 uncharacterized protein DUF4391 [Curtobacterium sp. PhB131]ROS66548.1 uncharacterized protein DUF4391 [Curtobacterium sp. PhB141]
MSDLLFQWPAGARFGARVPKERFYEHGSVSSAVREKFVTDVQRITWTHKLAEETINLTGTTAVPEIEIFELDSKIDDVADAVLTAIDKAVPNPIIFEITRERSGRREVRMATAHKSRGAGTSKVRCYYSTRWMPTDAERSALPTAISLAALYAALLASLTPIDVRPGEEASEVSERMESVRRLQREVAGLERKIQSEPQLNRRVELRRMLKTKQAELEEQK